jgi:RNA polymerase sigma factor (sigma-70 family)
MAGGVREKLVALLGVVLGASAAPGDAALRDTWEFLYPLWSRYLFGVGRKKLGLRPEWLEDMIHDVLYRILRRWEHYRECGADRLLATSCKALGNRALDEVRRRNRWRLAPVEVMREERMAAGAGESGDLLERRDRREWLHARVVELKEEQRENCKLACLHYLKGRTYKELAEKERMTEDAVKGRIKRGLQGFRALAGRHPLGGEPSP